MKMKPEMFEALRAAIEAAGGLVKDATMRQRWDMLWRSRFDATQLYKAGLDDNNIDTALRRIAKGSQS